MELIKLLKDAIEKKLREQQEEGIGFVHPATLAGGCFLAVAHELLGHPKAAPEAWRLRAMQAGTAAHERVAQYFRPFLMAQEVPFLNEEHRVKGRCDGLLFIPKALSKEYTGFYVLEIKSLSSTSFLEVKATGAPKPEHLRQCQIYWWGMSTCYGLPVRGGIICYENRDTLEYSLFTILEENAEIGELLERLRAVIELAKEGKLPEDPEFRLPPDHWAHRYCPYLPLCFYGQEAVKKNKKEISEGLRAKIIAQSIATKMVKKKEKRKRSLEELARDFGWE